MKQDKPLFYIIMRSDVKSMNPGKMVAQGSHATDDRAHLMEKMREMVKNGLPNDDQQTAWVGILDAYDQWRKEGNTFGTCYCLHSGNWQDVRKRVDEINDQTEDLFAVGGYVFDGTYPVRDGDVTHFVPFETCAWVFYSGFNPFAKELLKEFELCP